MPVHQALFDTRRDAEMAVERMVQTYGIDRDAIAIIADGTQNSAGDEAAGADLDRADHPAADDEAALHGAIAVLVTTASDAEDEAARAAFAEFEGHRATA